MREVANDSVVLSSRMGKGEMLEEVVRATLHSANPSAMLHHIASGIRTHMAEMTNDADKAFIKRLEEQLYDLKKEWDKKETDHWG